MENWVVGVDLGGTKIEVGVIDTQNRILERCRIPTRASEGPACVVERIAQCVQNLAEKLPPGERIAALGICSPGPVDHETGTLIDPPNLAGLHNAPLRQMLAKRLNIPVGLEHDAKATALGEFYYGAGRGRQDMVFIIVGTGVGGAIIVDGKLLRGPYNSAGEVGHITLDRNGDVCSCGSRGCVETFLGGPWLARRYQRAAHSEQPVTAEQVVRLASDSDSVAKRILAEAGEALGTAIASMAMILNIDRFVVGGSVAKAGDLLFEPARKAIPRHAYRSVSCGISVVGSELGDDGPILGCAWLARQALRDAASSSVCIQTPFNIPQAEYERLQNVEGIVFDIQRFSLHDGPGVRTNVFLKGCAMRCAWCANPESQRLQPELALFAQNCVVCNLFDEPCTAHWLHDSQSRAAHERYGIRADVCPSCALRRIGERRTAGSVIHEVLRDIPFYGESGGLTLTGGEPTFQPHMAEALLRLAKANRISTAMETSGYTRWKILERLIPYLDNVYFDVKHFDPETHRTFTGVDNVLILSNLRRLAELRVPVSVRVPLIPGFNATKENLRAVSDLILHMDGLEKRVCLLPYHTLGRAKYKALGREYSWEGHERLNEDQVKELAQIPASYGLSVSIGD